MKYHTKVFLRLSFALTAFMPCMAGGLSAGGGGTSCAVYGIAGKDYLPRTVIIRIRPEFRDGCRDHSLQVGLLENVLNALQADRVLKKFPGHQVPAATCNARGEKLADLSLIYELRYSAEIPVDRAVRMLMASGAVEYAVPHLIMDPLYIPDDPGNDSTLLYQHYHLSKIKAYEAWDYAKGDTATVTGILDSGTDLTHSDLKGNIKYNYNDPVDGIDNDNDGFLDNFYGWDLGSGDNNPQVRNDGNNPHGAHVSGIAAAATDNGAGISGTGFRCKFLPVKIADDSGYFTMGFEGIVYAADHGCRVINCSWGSPYSPGQYGQDIIDYATFNRDALVVAACGNANNSIPYYPASYDHVISVAATNQSDARMYLSGTYATSYGINVDVSAPGQDIFSTWVFPAFYAQRSGTSQAAPVVSGSAAIVRSRFPEFSALQAGEQLRVTADLIDTIPSNIPYAGLLCSGRVNLLRAVTDTGLSSVRLATPIISDNNDGVFRVGDTLLIYGDFVNYLAPAANVQVVLSTPAPHIQVLSNQVNLGNIPTLGAVNNLSAPFRIRLLPGLLQDETMVFTLTITDNTHTGRQYLSVLVNPNTMEVDTNLVAVTLTARGKLGYSDYFNYEGIGFTYKNDLSMMFSGGFLAGVSYTRVSDNIYGASGSFDEDFTPVRQLSRVLPPAVSDLDISGSFTDSLSGINRLKINVKQKAFAWNTPEDSKYIILEYTIRNDSSAPLAFLYAGLFVDWDIGPFTGMKDRVSYDTANRMGYTFNVDGSPYTAIKLLSPGPVKHYAFDMDGSNGSIQVYNPSTGQYSFSKVNKYNALRSNRPQAGMAPGGNDVGDMVSSGPFNLMPGDTAVVAFALIAGDHIADLRASAQAAQKRYNPASSVGEAPPARPPVEMGQNYPNPFSKETDIDVYVSEKQVVDLSLLDPLGHKVLEIYRGTLQKGGNRLHLKRRHLSPGIYYYRLVTTNGGLTKKLTIVD